MPLNTHAYLLSDISIREFSTVAKSDFGIESLSRKKETFKNVYKNECFLCSPRKNNASFAHLVSLESVVAIASGRCPSKTLQIRKPENLLFHTFTLKCSLPHPPLGHP